MTDSRSGSDPQMSATNLYHEEVFTDRRVGTIQRLTPVTPEAVPMPPPGGLRGQTRSDCGGCVADVRDSGGDSQDAAEKFGEVARSPWTR
jgi:hypothetical protein